VTALMRGAHFEVPLPFAFAFAFVETHLRLRLPCLTSRIQA
jgi:hypothetical protein